MAERLRRVVIKVSEIPESIVADSLKRYAHLKPGELTEMAMYGGLDILVSALRPQVNEGETVLAKFVFEDGSKLGWFKALKENSELLFDQESLIQAFDIDRNSDEFKSFNPSEKMVLEPDEPFYHPLSSYEKDGELVNMWLVVSLLINTVRGTDKGIDGDPNVAQEKLSMLISKCNPLANVNHYMGFIKTHHRREMMDVCNMISTSDRHILEQAFRNLG